MKILAVLYRDADGVFRKYPFRHGYTLRAYAHFEETARSHGLRAVFAKPEWYSGGKLRLSWSLMPQRLKKDIRPDFVFDRCLSRDRKTNRFLQNLRRQIKKTVGILNDPFIEDICNDKILTYRHFGKWMPKTVSSENGIDSIAGDRIVIKPRFGAGGKDVRVAGKGKLKVRKDFLVQEFIDTSAGIKNAFRGTHDLRVVMLNGAVVDYYVRFPRKGLVSNISLGGKMARIRKLPRGVLELCRHVDRKLEGFRPRFYSIDFLIDKSQKPRIVELNSHPTMDVYYQFPEKRHAGIYDTMCRRLAGSIVQALRDK